MTLWRKTTRFYADEDEVQGLYNALCRRIDQSEGSDAQHYYMGAAFLVNLLLEHNEFRDQTGLVGLFDETLRNEGIRLKGMF